MLEVSGDTLPEGSLHKTRVSLSLINHAVCEEDYVEASLGQADGFPSEGPISLLSQGSQDIL